jgi:predicted DNA-binding protein (UPF0251 family)
MDAPTPPCEYFVYQIRARDHGRIVYVGMGNLARCHAKHRKNPLINNLIDAGGTFRPEIIAGPMTREEAWAEEIRLIALHKRVCDGGHLLNMSTGGMHSGLGVPPETRAKISAALRGRIISAETRAKVSAVNRGRIISAETRAKISAAKKGKPRGPRGPVSAETRAKISAAGRGRTLSPETIAKRTATFRADSNRGTEIEARRERAKELVDNGMSQRQAAAVLGVSQKTIQNDLAALT